MYQIIYFYPNLQYQALFELLTAPLVDLSSPMISQLNVDPHFCFFDFFPEVNCDL